MKTSTKLTIGVGVVAVAGIATAAIVSGKIIEKVHYASNRCKARKFVEKKFGGNEKILDLVDKLSDEDLESIITISKKVKKGQKQVKEYGRSVKDSTEETKEKLVSYLTEAFDR